MGNDLEGFMATAIAIVLIFAFIGVIATVFAIRDYAVYPGPQIRACMADCETFGYDFWRIETQPYKEPHCKCLEKTEGTPTLGNVRGIW